MSDADIGEEFRREMDELMGQLGDQLSKVVGSIDDRIALPPQAGDVLADFREPLPEVTAPWRRSRS